MRDNAEPDLARLLRSDGKHAAYQELPPCFPANVQGLGVRSTPRLDGRRYEFLCRHLRAPLRERRVVDIGANIGYFALRLAHEEGARVLAYEPHTPHAEAIRVIRDLCGLPVDQVDVLSTGVGLRELDSLPPARLVLLLNVLQHAGQDFDADLVPSVEAWRPYAIRYLAGLRTKADMLFFQLGYTWLGHGSKLCEDDKIIDFTLSLVEEAGWRVTSCGVMRKPDESAQYEEYPLSRDGENSVWLPGRKDNWVSRARIHLAGGRTQEKKNLYRFAQRPVWLLTSTRA